MDTMNILIMVIVGALSGTLAARIMSGNTFGFVTNALLGIAGAIVGGALFNFLGITPGANIVKALQNTFGVTMPQNLVGMIVSATVGSIIILYFARIVRNKR